MNFFSEIKDFFVEKKQQPTLQAVAWESSRPAMASRYGYKNSSLIYQCISKLALAFPEAWLRVMKTEDDSVFDSHPLQGVLDRPNLMMSQAELQVLTILFTATTGNCYWHILRDDNGQVRGLWPYSGLSIIPAVASTGYIKYFEHVLQGKKTEIKTEDVVHYKWPMVDLERPWLGLSPLTAIHRECAVDEEMSKYLQQLLLNDCTPRTLLIDRSGMAATPQQVESLRAQFAQQHSGDARGSVGVLTGGLEVQRLGLNPGDMDFDALRRMPEARVTGAFLMDVLYAGVTSGMDAATYSNRQGARKFFFEDTMLKLWRLQSDTITRAFEKEYGTDFYVWHDTSEVLALNETQDSLYARTISAVQAGIITTAEARIELGYDPAKKVTVEPADENKDLSYYSKDNLKYFGRYDLKMARLAGELRPAFKRAIKKIERSLLSKEKADNIFAFSIDKNYFTTILSDEAAPMLERALPELIAEAARDVSRVPLSDTVVGEKASAALTKVTSQFKFSSNTIEKSVLEIARANTGASAEVMRGALEDKFKNKFSRSYTDMLARTISTNATGAAQAEVYKDYEDLFDLTWFSQRDERVRPSHRGADGQVRVDGLFHVGGSTGEHPGAMSSGDENTRCRCIMRPRPKEKK